MRGAVPSASLFLGLIVTVAFLPIVGRGLRHSHLEFRPEDSRRAALYEWIRAETPEESVFAVPPSWQRFRLQARRPMVVDFKSIPRYAPNRIEWLERMRALTGLERPGTEAGPADSAYALMDCERAQSLRRRFGARYVLHERPKTLPCGSLVYEDELFRVWDLDGEN